MCEFRQSQLLRFSKFTPIEFDSYPIVASGPFASGYKTPPLSEQYTVDDMISSFIIFSLIPKVVPA